MRKQLRTFLGLTFVLASTGCMAPKRFAYKMDEQGFRACGTQFDKVCISVAPLEDVREDKSSTEGWSLLCQIPLVPYVSFYNNELESFSGDTGEIQFKPKTELHAAIVEHLKRDGLGDVATVNQRLLDGHQYVLHCKIKRLRIEGFRTLYGLGCLPGGILPYFGAPWTYATSYLDLEFSLMDTHDKCLFEKVYSAKRDYKVGMWYNWNVFKQVGFNLAMIMNELCADIAQVIADDYPDAKLTQRTYTRR